MILDVNLLNSGKANRLVPKSEVLSAEATFSSFISLASTFSLISNSAKSRYSYTNMYTCIRQAYATLTVGLTGRVSAALFLLGTTGGAPGM